MGLEFNTEQIHALYQIENWWNSRDKQVYELVGPAGSGKAQPIDTLIPTPYGEIELGDLQVGDYVFDRHGLPTRVVDIFEQGMLDCYKITFDDGRVTYCNDEHLWECFTEDSKHTTVTRTLKEIALSNRETLIPLCDPVNYGEKEFEILPQFLAVKIAILCGSKRAMDTLPLIIEKNKALNGIECIPKPYFYGSLNQRLTIISCLEYYLVPNMVKYKIGDIFRIETKYERIAKDIIKLCYSLGIKATLHDNSNDIYEVHIHVNNELIRKFLSSEMSTNDGIAHHELSFNNTIKITSIEYTGEKREMRCIRVDNDEHLYLTNDFIVTHNTTLIRYFIDRINLDINDVAFVAFMGKASMQMARNGLPAQTIHSLIYDYEKVLDLDENGKIQLNDKGRVKTKFQFSKRKKLFKKIKLIVLDEASMVNKEMAEDLLSFNIPMIVLGDLNQLPPVFGKPYFLDNPDTILTQVMRQQEGNPIIWLAHRALEGHPLQLGSYGDSFVISRNDINPFILSKSDIVLTCTNKLRYQVNTLFRTQIKRIIKQDMIQEGEKVICRKNNWSRCLNNSIYLTNGMTGTVDYVDMSTFNGKTIKIDFKPDFMNKPFKNLTIDYLRLFDSLGGDIDVKQSDPFSFTRDTFEFAYAITVHSSQGSQYDNVVFINEKTMLDAETMRKLRYTAITRARQKITIVI